MGLWDLETIDDIWGEEPPKSPKKSKGQKKFEDDDVPVYVTDYYEAVPTAQDLVPLIEPEHSKYPRGLLTEQKVFLAHYMACGVVTTALKKAGMTHRRYREYLEHDDIFCQAMEAATEAIADAVEQEALKRALQGSDKLLIKMLESLRPAKFGRQSTQFFEGHMDVRVNNWADLARQATVIDAETVQVHELKEDNDNE